MFLMTEAIFNIFSKLTNYYNKTVSFMDLFVADIESLNLNPENTQEESLDIFL